MNAMTKSLTALFVLMTFVPAIAGAQENRAGRYTMHKTDSGFVRLDTETGAVSHCHKKDDAWRCQDMASTATASPGEFKRLKKENADLKAEIKRLDELLGLRGNRNRSAADRNAFKLPTEKEVDQALDYFERMLKKFQDRLQRLERNSEAPKHQL